MTAEQLTISDLVEMTSDEIRAAFEAGRLDRLLGKSQPGGGEEDPLLRALVFKLGIPYPDARPLPTGMGNVPIGSPSLLDSLRRSFES